MLGWVRLLHFSFFAFCPVLFLDCREAVVESRHLSLFFNIEFDHLAFVLSGSPGWGTITVGRWRQTALMARQNSIYFISLYNPFSSVLGEKNESERGVVF